MRRLQILPIALALLAACGPAGEEAAPPGTASPSVPPASPADAEPVTLLLGYIPDVQFAPFYLAQQDGSYADVGLEVSIEHRAAPDLVREVAAGQAQFGIADATDTMISRTSGIPVRYVATLFGRFPVALIGPAGAVPPDASGLAGLRIGTPGRFGSSWHALLALLDSAGLSADDIEVREYPQFNQAQGLANGDVDLITGFRNNEPIRLRALGVDPQLVVVDEVVPLPGPGLIVSDDLLAGDPELVRAFATATARAQADVIRDPALGMEAAEAAVPSVGEDRETARAVLDATAELWAGEGGFHDGRLDVERWTSAYETMRRLGFIDGTVPLDEMIAPELLAP